MPRSTPVRNIVSVKDFDRSFCNYLFELAGVYAARLDEDSRSCRGELPGCIVELWFKQPSTRTFVSFYTAALRLGMDVIPVIDPSFSSESKGESEDHSMRTVGGFRPEVLVMRHDKIGGVARAVESMSKAHSGPVPIINAGDGKGEHPTQAFLDIYTLLQLQGRGIRADLSDAHIVIGGDLQGRVPRSLAFKLCDYGPRVTFVSDPALAVGDDVKSHLHQKGVRFAEETDIESCLKTADYWYWTRTQNDQRTDEEKERLAHVDPRRFQLTTDHVRQMRSNAKILHPMPIDRTPGVVSEIESAIDDSPQAAYWQQSANGVPIRMATLKLLCS